MQAQVFYLVIALILFYGFPDVLKFMLLLVYLAHTP